MYCAMQNVCMISVSRGEYQNSWKVSSVNVLVHSSVCYLAKFTCMHWVLISARV